MFVWTQTALDMQCWPQFEIPRPCYSKGTHDYHQTAGNCTQHHSLTAAALLQHRRCKMQVVVDVMERGKLLLWPHLLLACVALLPMTWLHLWMLVLDLLSKVRPSLQTKYPIPHLACSGIMHSVASHCLPAAVNGLWVCVSFACFLACARFMLEAQCYPEHHLVVLCRSV